MTEGGQIRETVEGFIERSSPRLVGALVMSVGSRAVAEELAQEAYVRCWQAWDRIENPDAWIYRVAFNLARSRFRRRAAEARAVRTWHGLQADHSTDVCEPEGPLANEHFRVLIRVLSTRQREAVVLRYLVDLSVPEIAREMGCSEGTIKATLHQAKRRLQEEWINETE